MVVEYGMPSAKLERMKSVVQFPKRLVPKAWRKEEDEAPEDIIENASDYLRKNQLTDVTVFVDHYDPAGEWKRLCENRRIAPAWRYSLGVLRWTGDALLPGPVFGGSRYNPFTNSLHLNDKSTASALQEAAYAKQVHAHKYPGWYVALGKLPGLSAVQQGDCAKDVVGYARAEQNWDIEREAYEVLYPRVGAETFSVASAFVPLWWAQPVVGLGGAAAGRLAGWSVTKRRQAQLDAEAEPQVVVDDGVRWASFEEPAAVATDEPSRLNVPSGSRPLQPTP